MEKSGSERDLCLTHSKTLSKGVQEGSQPRYPLENANASPTRGETYRLRCASVEMTRGRGQNRIHHHIPATPHLRPRDMGLAKTATRGRLWLFGLGRPCGVRFDIC